MTFRTLTSKVVKNLANIPGWVSDRKIVVFESDDWGSIRMPSKETFNTLVGAGFNFDNDRYNTLDSLESNSDMEMLLDMLSRFKDKNGNPPTFTAMCIVANPDFKTIKEQEFQAYAYHTVNETFARYPDHDRVLDLWRKGANENLFRPQFHGREHLNVLRWLKDLKAGNKMTRLAFAHQVTGVGRSNHPSITGTYQAAFDIESKHDNDYLKTVLLDGLRIFKNTMGYGAKFFVPTNGLFHEELESELHQSGVEYINVAKVKREPQGMGRHRLKFHYLGQTNRYGQTYLTRNAIFEPSDCSINDWVDSCLKDIKNAFLWRKPAIISTHRINYVGYINAHNRSHGIKQLQSLIKAILEHWPSVEFMSSDQLGDLITMNRKRN